MEDLSCYLTSQKKTVKVEMKPSEKPWNKIRHLTTDGYYTKSYSSPFSVGVGSFPENAR